jgi:hypothetical protein
VLAGRHSLPGHGSSLAPATWALVDVSRSGCSPMLAPVPVATGSPPSAASSASCAAPPSHGFSLSTIPAMRRVYDVTVRLLGRPPQIHTQPPEYAVAKPSVYFAIHKAWGPPPRSLDGPPHDHHGRATPLRMRDREDTAHAARHRSRQSYPQDRTGRSSHVTKSRLTIVPAGRAPRANQPGRREGFPRLRRQRPPCGLRR